MSCLYLLFTLFYFLCSHRSCQGTLIFSNISTIYSSFPSAIFCFTSWYYSSMTSTNISKHLQALCWVPLYLLLFFPIFFHSRFWYLCQTDSETDFTYDPYVYFYLHLCLFLPQFSFLFLMLSCLTFYLWDLIPFTYSPLAGLYLFLLGCYNLWTKREINCLYSCSVLSKFICYCLTVK